MRWLREGLMLVVCILVVVAFLLSASWAVAPRIERGSTGFLTAGNCGRDRLAGRVDR
jgi:hypothetical protein